MGNNVMKASGSRIPYGKAFFSVVCDAAPCRIILLILLSIVARPGLAQQPTFPSSGQTPAPDVMSESRTVVPASPSVPHVTYAGGQLSVSALHCSLQEVLRAIANATGAQLEIPSGLAGEAVAIHQGPGSPTEVLARILNGSSFDYMIVGNGRDGTLQRVVLTPRNGVPNDQQQNVASAGQAGQEPELYGGQGFSVTPGSEEDVAAAVAREQENERNADPNAKAQGQILDAMQKEMLRQRHAMQEQQQQPAPPQ
jgi:hypothetical protein